MSNIIISTESGSDLPYKISEPLNIQIIPLHVSFGKKTLCEGTFDVDDIFMYYNEHKSLPKTSAVNPDEYVEHFKSIFRRYPDCKIIHISNSSKISVTYQNAVIASNEFDADKICIIDSANASAGAGIVTMTAAQLVQKFGDKITFDEYVSLINQTAKRVHCSLVPSTLEYFKAGGRISGATHLGASVLGIKPCVHIVDGYIEAGKKYRGNVTQFASKYLEDFVTHHNLEKEFIVIIYSNGLSRNLLFSLKRQAHKMGFKKSWCFQTGAVISCHIGPGGLGFAGISKNKKVL